MYARILATHCARGLLVILTPSQSRGRRECRMRAAPEVSCAVYPKKGAHEHTGAAEDIRHSLRNGFTAYNALSPVSHVLLPPSTPTMGRQDHTSLPYAFTPIVRALPRPSQPRPSLVTTADAPWSGRDAIYIAQVLLLEKRIIFDYQQFLS